MPHSASATARKLPRRSFAAEPVHLRITEICRKAIVEGNFDPGERFPSERELAERYAVSRATANKVISSLVAEGLLEIHKGIGSRVCKQRTLFASLGGMESFTAHVRAQGMAPTTEVLTFDRKLTSEIPEAARAGLGLGLGSGKEKGETLIYLERLRLADGVPMILEHRWVREKLARGLERGDVAESFYRVLEEKFDLPMTGEEHTIAAVLLKSSATKLLRMKKPAAALRVEGTGFVKGDTPLWYQRLHYRGDHYQLHNQTRGPAASNLELRFSA